MFGFWINDPSCPTFGVHLRESYLHESPTTEKEISSRYSSFQRQLSAEMSVEENENRRPAEQGASNGIQEARLKLEFLSIRFKKDDEFSHGGSESDFGVFAVLREALVRVL